MAVSITVLISLVIGLVATICVVISFVPTYLAGVSEVQATVDTLRASSVGRATVGVDKYFSIATNVLQGIARAQLNGAADLAHADDLSLLRLMCSFAVNISGVNSAMLVQPNVPDGNTWFTLCDTRRGYPTATMTATNLGMVWRYDQVAGAPNTTGAPLALLPASKAVVASSANPIMRVLASNRGLPRWVPPYEGYDSASFTLGFTFTDRFGGIAYTSIDVIPAFVKTLLGGLGLRPGARALIVDYRTRYLIGVSWNESVQILRANWSDLRIPGPQRMTLLRMPNMTDPLIGRVLGHFGSEDAFFALSAPHSSTFGGGSDRVFVDVADMTDAFGMHLRVLVAMPERDFLADVVAARTGTITAVVVSLVVMLLLGVLFSIVITRPIKRIGFRMYRTAALQDDDKDDAPSALAEVRDMQEAYTAMKGELNRMKVYLPQSVLAAAGDDEDEESDLGGSQAKSSSVRVSEGSKSKTGATPDHKDTQSQSSRASRVRDGHSAVGAGAVVGLNTGKSVLTKKVVVAVFNLARFYEAVGGVGAAASLQLVSRVQSTFLTVVAKAVRDNKGVVDVFHGDRVVATFNAVGNVATAGKRGAMAALTAVQEAAKEAHLPPVSVGLDYGTALVGNMGSIDMQRFNVIGPVYANAMAIERVAAARLRAANARGTSGAPALPWCVCLSDALLAEVGLEMAYKCFTAVRLPGAHADISTKRPTAIAALVGLKTAKQDEWQYMLADGDSADPNLRLNEAFVLAVNGNVAEATSALQAHIAANAAAAASDPAVATLQRLLATADASTGGTVKCEPVAWE